MRQKKMVAIVAALLTIAILGSSALAAVDISGSEVFANGETIEIHDGGGTGTYINTTASINGGNGSTDISNRTIYGGSNQEHAKNSFYDFAAKESDGGNPGSGEIPDGNVNPGGNENPGSSETPGSGDSGGASIPLSPGTPTPPRIPLGMPATGSPKAGSALAVLFIMLSLCAGTWVAHPIKRAKGL